MIDMDEQPSLNDSYKAIVEEIQSNYARCSVLVSGTELNFNFPLDVIKVHNIGVGERFTWHPTNDGTITKENIEKIIDPEPSSEELRSLREHFGL
jgi:hypothetical protein